MKNDRTNIVRGRGGLLGASEPAVPGPGGESFVRVRLEGGGSIRVPEKLLVPQEDGSLFLDLDPEEEIRYRLGEEAGDVAEESEAVPVVREDLHVDKRRVETGKVTVRKKVTRRLETVDPFLWQETVDVRRVPVNRVLDAPVDIRREGDVVIVPVMEEVLVVEKQLLLKEEIHIRRERTQVQRPVEVEVRSEEAQVERTDLPEGGKPKAA